MTTETEQLEELRALLFPKDDDQGDDKRDARPSITDLFRNPTTEEN